MQIYFPMITGSDLLQIQVHCIIQKEGGLTVMSKSPLDTD